ncbi:hypothetical protein E6O75_ATG11482 [Venturia nashicola]|uniref:Uncharacterized protein n=1 Tax=Venturia nashicola TaxID=86259 RepID=A0A4Z1NYP4_9PEZI|nr:hypothetical protein E6O75_ATG11482 [Venturia nashicola]
MAIPSAATFENEGKEYSEWTEAIQQGAINRIWPDANYAYVRTRQDADKPWNCFITVGKVESRQTWSAMVMVELAEGGMRVATGLDRRPAEWESTIGPLAAIEGLDMIVREHVGQAMNKSISYTRTRRDSMDEDDDDDGNLNDSGLLNVPPNGT